jgi:uncharacterized protein YjiS (DUF1127 family)
MTDVEECDFVFEQASPATPSASLWTRLATLIDVIDDCFEVRRQRRALSMMDNHMLKDIGLSRADVEHETTRSFWDTGKR